MRKMRTHQVNGENNHISVFIDGWKRIVSNPDISSEQIIRYGEQVFASPSVAECFLYFLRKGAGTARVIQSDLLLPEATVYRALSRLRRLGLITELKKLDTKDKKGKIMIRGGPRPVLYALPFVGNGKVIEAEERYYKYRGEE